MESQEKQYKYYAFISYSRKNSKAAKYLHKQLEHFRVPVKYVAKENLPPHQKFLRPVFRDRRDLEVGEGSFTNDIKAAIEQSRYLIVLCSLESAASIWVNEEIKHFLATHNNDYNTIVPVILNGEPGSGGDTECLPEALRSEEITMRNLPSMIPDEGDTEKTGWENGAVQAMSYMLKVQREKIKATVDAEKVRQAKIYTLIGIVATIIFALLAGWAIHAERQASINEAKAKEQAEIATKSLEFLRDVFQSSDPTQKGNKDIKVLDALNAKLPEIEKLQPWQLKASVTADIGLIFSNLGEYDKALSLLTQAYELNYKYRPESEEIATSYNNIGGVYNTQGKYVKALEYYQKALVIRQKNFDQYHPDIATCYNNIGSVCYNQCNYDKALEYYQKALAIWSKSFDNNYQYLAQCYNNIGVVYYMQKDYTKTLEYYQKALTARKKKLSKNHPDIAQSYNNIGSLYDSTGNYAKALEYHQKALEIYKISFGKNNPNVSICYNNIGMIYANQGDYDKALEYYQKALEIKTKFWGINHSDVALTYNNIGILYYKQKKYINAITYLQQAVNIALNTLGKQHLYTKDFKRNLESARKKLKR